MTWLNLAAAELLGVDRERASGLPLIAVLRDHRLERAWLERREEEVRRGERVLRAAPVAGGLALRDVTEAARAQERARELLAVLSHELRTPATTIRSTLEALRYDLPDAQRERFLERAEGEAARLVRLLEDLTVDTRPPRARSVPPAEALARAGAVLRPLLDEHRVRLEVDLPDTAAWADPDKLLQVLINLIGNAAVHGPDDAVVRVTGETAMGEAGGVLRLRVIDAGAPLRADAVEALFEPHARGAGVAGAGTGLGLYIVRSIAERWGGRAWGRPLDGGNEFGVEVPLAPRRDAAPPTR